MVEEGSAPEWLQVLEQKLQKGKATLGHDAGAGAPCNHCGPECPGLNLHFWRKVCKDCHCSKDVHDVPDEDISGWAQFELLGGSRLKRKMPMLHIQGITDEPVKMDWVPPNTSLDIVSDYMASLGENLAPVSGSSGAAKRRELLRRQVPLHDISADLASNTQTPEEQDSHKEYIAEIKNKVVGQGNIIRIGTVRKADVGNIDIEESKPVYSQVKSYSLPLKVSSLGKGIRYSAIPKNGTDKFLTLDNAGNVVCKSAHLPDFRQSAMISKPVKDKLNLMKIESDRIKSAVEHGPVYDKMFTDLKELKVPIESDVYLSPIKSFRDQWKVDPRFKTETSDFVKAQGGQIMPDSLNNNETAASNFPKKGTIYAPNGEIWSWSTQDEDDEENNSIPPIYSKDGRPSYNATNRNIPTPGKYGTAGYIGDEAPPLPNYDTYPGAMPSEASDVLNVNTTPAKIRIRPELPLNKPDKIPQKSDNLLVDSLTGLMIQHPDEDFANPTAVSCKRCTLSFSPGEIAVKAERAGSDVAWHPQCFTCCQCNNLLADLLYFYHKGDIYCGRDLAEALKIKRCAACDELIFAKRSTVAEGKFFHLLHFCCYNCDIPLGGKQYVPDEKSNQPMCLDCYEKVYANTCNTCKSIIKPDQQGVSWSKFHWHGTCFNCSYKQCSKSLLGSKFVIRNDMPFCGPACLQNSLNSL